MELHLIDFGLCQKYTDNQNQHKFAQLSELMDGNVHFMSVN